MRFYIQRLYIRFIKAALPLFCFYVILIMFTVDDVKKNHTACYYRNDFLNVKFGTVSDYSFSGDPRTTSEKIFPRKMNISFTVDCQNIANHTIQSLNIQRQCEASECEFGCIAFYVLSLLTLLGFQGKQVRMMS